MGFEIELREDDREILDEIQRQLGCEHVYHLRYHRYQKWKPHVKYRVSNFADIRGKVIPFFQQNPLFGKKLKQFELFCQAADVIEQGTHKVDHGVQRLQEIQRVMRQHGK